jgi:hypothetical protein
MSGHSPYPRPYYKGHNRAQDEKLANELFYGASAINKKTGRWHSHYLSAGSPEERRALDALRRLLSFSCGDLDPAILEGLLGSLDSRGGLARQLAFKYRKKGKRHDFAADLDVAMRVGALVRAGEQTEAAVAKVREELGLSRKAVFAAIKRFNDTAFWLKRSVVYWHARFRSSTLGMNSAGPLASDTMKRPRLRMMRLSTSFALTASRSYANQTASGDLPTFQSRNSKT